MAASEVEPHLLESSFAASMQLRILSLTTVYPTPLEPSLGTFVRTRLQYLGASMEVKVVAPVPIINYGRRLIRWPRLVAWRRRDAEVEVISPRWLYPPRGGALNGVLLFLQLLAPVIRLRRGFPFQMIDAHFGHPEGVAAALLAWVLRCPFTITLRGCELLHGRHWGRRVCMAWAMRRAQRVLAVSENLRQFAIALGVPPSRAVTVPNGIDTGSFHPRDRQSSRAEYAVSANERLIVSAGHLIRLKGHHRIVAAVRALADEGVNAVLLIAGGRGRAEDYEPALRQEIARCGLENRVRLLGHLNSERLAKLLSAADVFCLASEREGWPNVLHEALACGTPVVATNVGGVPEMIPSAQYGIIVPPDDPAALAGALRTALARPWERRAIAAWGQARGWRQVAAEVAREMERACEPPAAAPHSRAAARSC